MRFNFDSYIAERTQHFTARPWLFARIGEWLASPGRSRYFLITAEPGGGKTGVAGQVCNLSRGLAAGDGSIPRDAIAAHHFCFSKLKESLEPPEFPESIGGQLAASVPGFESEQLRSQPELRPVEARGEVNAESVTGSAVGLELHVGAETAWTKLNREVLRPLRALYKNGLDRDLVILVDALDEASLFPGPETILDLITGLGDDLPRVRFLVTSRPEVEIVRTLHEHDAHLVHVSLSDGEEKTESRNDIRVHVAEALSRWPEIVQKLAPELAAPDLVVMLSDRADGNFLWTHYVLGMLRDPAVPVITAAAIHDLPGDLRKFYLGFLRRLSKANAARWLDEHAKVLGLLVVALEELTRDELGLYCGLDGPAVTRVLHDIRQLLDVNQDEEPRRYSLYHRSFADFLLSAASEEYQCEESRLHQAIAARWLESIGPADARYVGRTGRYALRNIAAHLFALRADAAMRRELFALASKPWMALKRRTFGHDASFANDVALVAEAAAESRDFLMELRATAILVAVRSCTAAIPSAALVLLARLGKFDRVDSYLALPYSNEARLRTVMHIARAILRDPQEASAQTITWIETLLRGAWRFGASETAANEARFLWAQALARLGRFDELRPVVELVASEFCDELREIAARTALDRGDAEALHGWADQLSGWRRESLYTGALEAAARMSAEAENALAALLPASELPQLADAAVRALLEAGHFDEASRLAARGTDRARVEVESARIVRLAATGDLGALTTPDALVRAARGLVERGDAAAAIAVAKDAEESVRGNVLAEIAVTAARRGDGETVGQVYDLDRDVLAGCKEQIISDLLDNGLADRARQILDADASYTDPEVRESLIDLLVARDRIEDAVAVAAKAQSHQTEALYLRILTFVRPRQMQRAVPPIAERSAPFEELFAEAARIIARRGDVAAVAALAAATGHPRGERVMVAAAIEAFEHDDDGTATSLLAQMTEEGSEWINEDDAVAVAGFLGRAIATGAAERWIGHDGFMGFRDHLRVTLADALAQNGHPERAAEMLAQVSPNATPSTGLASRMALAGYALGTDLMAYAEVLVAEGRATDALAVVRAAADGLPEQPQHIERRTAISIGTHLVRGLPAAVPAIVRVFGAALVIEICAREGRLELVRDLLTGNELDEALDRLVTEERWPAAIALSGAAPGEDRLRRIFSLAARRRRLAPFVRAARTAKVAGVEEILASFLDWPSDFVLRIEALPLLGADADHDRDRAVEKLVKRGELDRALELARGITADWSRRHAIASVVASARVQNIPIDTAGRWEPADNAGITAEAAGVLIEHGCFHDALFWARQAHGWRKEDLARKFAKAGDLHSAVELAESETNWDRDRILKEAAAASPARLNEALSIAGRIADRAVRLEALSGILRALVEAGEIDAALQLLPSVDSSIHGLTEVATALFGAGRTAEAEKILERALRLINALEDDHARNDAIAQLARVLSARGHFEQAEQLALLLARDGDTAAGVLLSLSRDRSRGGETAEALDLAHRALGAARLATGVFAPDAEADALATLGALSGRRAFRESCSEAATAPRMHGRTGEMFVRLAELRVKAPWYIDVHEWRWKWMVRGDARRILGLARARAGELRGLLGMALLARVEHGLELAEQAVEALIRTRDPEYRHEYAVGRMLATLDAPQGLIERLIAASLPRPLSIAVDGDPKRARRIGDALVRAAPDASPAAAAPLCGALIDCSALVEPRGDYLAEAEKLAARLDPRSAAYVLPGFAIAVAAIDPSTPFWIDRALQALAAERDLDTEAIGRARTALALVSVNRREEAWQQLRRAVAASRQTARKTFFDVAGQYIIGAGNDDDLLHLAALFLETEAWWDHR